MKETAPSSVLPVSKPTLSEDPPRAVIMTLGEPANGRLPLSIVVVPTEDLDARGGLFIDMRLGRVENPASAGGVAAVAPSASTGAEPRAAARASQKSQPPGAGTDAPATPEHAGNGRSRPLESKREIVSHQVGQGLKLTVGQSESFRAEVATPHTPPDGETWFLRARFAALQGRDLKSAWARM